MTGTVYVYEIGMSAPDIVYLEVRDQDITRGNLAQLGSPDAGALGAFVQRTNPATSTTQWANVVGQLNGVQKMFLRFGDVEPTNYLNRALVDNAANWATIGGLTVTAVSRLTMVWDQGRCVPSGSALNASTMRHMIRLKLSGKLAPGTYTVSCSSNPFPATSFTFNDKTTRCVALRGSQIGHRHADSDKRAYLSDWALGFPNEGVIDYAGTYGLTSFQIIDSTGWTHFFGTINLRYNPAQVDGYLPPVPVNGGTSYIANDILTVVGGTGTAPTLKVISAPSGVITQAKWNTSGSWTVAPTDPVSVSGGTGTGATFKTGLLTYTSTSNAPKTLTAITRANPGVVACTAHGFSTGNVVQFRGIGGMTQLEGKAETITFVDADHFSIGVDTSAFGAYTAGTYLTGYDSQVYPTFQANQAATKVFELDYSTWAPNQAGTFYVYIPGLGVSDAFTVDEAVHYQTAATMMKGYYNQLWGCALSSAIGGYDRPVNFKDGVAGCTILESLMPCLFTDQVSAATPSLSSTAGAASPWITANEVTGWYGGWSDAGDWDMYLVAHATALYNLLTLGYQCMPAASRFTSFGFPKSSASIGSTYAGTDYLPDAVHMAIWYIDTFRRTQKIDGSVYGGLAYGGPSAGSTIASGGGSLIEPSWCSLAQGYCHAADHASNYCYAAVAGALASLFYGEGLNTLGDLWKNSAVLAYTWAENLYQDYKTNGATGSVIQAFYNTTLNLTSNAGWTTGQFATAMAGIKTVCDNGTFFGYNFRQWAATALYRATGSAAYISGMTITYGYDGFELFLNPAATGAQQTAVINGFKNGCVNASGTLAETLAGNIPYASMRIANGFGTGGSANGGSIDIQRLHFMDTTNAATYRQLLHQQANYMAGANQQGLCCATGLGVRQPRNHLHRDREAMGLLTLPGYTLYMWTFDNTLGNALAIDNFSTDSPLNFTVILPLAGSPNEGTFGDERIVTYQFMIPAMQQHWDNSFIIFHTEFTTEQQLVPCFLHALFRHGWDGNSATALNPSAKYKGARL